MAFNAIIPLMTVVNYSVQETFGANTFFWAGIRWFEEVLGSPRFHAALGRQLFFTFTILVIEVPLGVAIALTMPRKGPWVSVCLVLMALPSDPLEERGRRDLEHLCVPEIGLLGRSLNAMGFDFNFTRGPRTAWLTVILMDVVLDVARGAAGYRAWSRSRMPTIRPPRSTARGAGRSFATSSCRR